MNARAHYSHFSFRCLAKAQTETPRSPRGTFFGLQNGVKLAIWAGRDMAHEAKVPLGPRSATEFALGHNVGSNAEVDAVMAQAKLAGAVITDPPHDAFWGGYTGSFQDPDGHLWGVAWNPDWELAD